jgi:hypothetical protein
MFTYPAICYFTFLSYKNALGIFFIRFLLSYIFYYVIYFADPALWYFAFHAIWYFPYSAIWNFTYSIFCYFCFIRIPLSDVFAFPLSGFTILSYKNGLGILFIRFLVSCISYYVIYFAYPAIWYFAFPAIWYFAFPAIWYFA